MTKDADNNGYHCIKCGNEVQFPCCKDCFPEEHKSFEQDFIDISKGD